jgi:hypothetical protein
VARKRRRRKYYKDFLFKDSCDGLGTFRGAESNKPIARRSYSFSIFDQDNICIELENKNGKRKFHNVSIKKEVRKVNSHTEKLNGYKDRIKGR